MNREMQFAYFYLYSFIFSDDIGHPKMMTHWKAHIAWWDGQIARSTIPTESLETVRIFFCSSKLTHAHTCCNRQSRSQQKKDLPFPWHWHSSFLNCLLGHSTNQSYNQNRKKLRAVFSISKTPIHLLNRITIIFPFYSTLSIIREQFLFIFLIT